MSQVLQKWQTAQNVRKKERTRDALSTFVPETMKWILHQEKILKTPYRRQFPSVALFADISGFTKLSERLSDSKYLPSSLGTETLADNINSYLTMIVKEIIGAGGDIFKFAGDALLCVWPPADDEMNDLIKAWKNLPETVLRAIQCALSIQDKYPEMSKTGVEELTLRVKLGIGVGNVDVLVVGGIMGRYENLPAGQAFFEAFNCENDCSPKQVIISQKCYQMCKRRLGECTPVGEVGNYWVQSVRARGRKKKHINNSAQNSTNNDELFKKLKCYIPSAVVPHLRMPEQIWAGELRQVTIMFLSLPFTSADIKNLDKFGGKILNDIHESIRTLQNIIYRYQGSLNKFLVDDKGSTVMAIFGLPPVAHRNDPERAVMAALDLRDAFMHRHVKKNILGGIGGGLMNRLPIKGGDKKNDEIKKKKHIIAIGITSGSVYLGLVGGAGSRREYTVLGDKTNLAARLMGLSKKYPNEFGEVIIDEEMKLQIDVGNPPGLEWEYVKEKMVKGKKHPVRIWKPMAKKHTIIPAIPPTAWLTDASDGHYISQCSKIIEELSNTGHGHIVFVEGEVGLGKAALISRVMAQTKSRIWWLWGKGRWTHETREQFKFPVWKQILLSFNQSFSFCKKKNRNSFKKYLSKRRPDLVKWAFLLSYFDLLEFLTEEELALYENDKERREYRKKILSGTTWQRNEQLVQTLKDKIQLRMTEAVRKFEMEIETVTNKKEKQAKQLAQQAKWKKEAEEKVNKKIGNYIYDIVICLLEWAGGKPDAKPIAVVIDAVHWLRTWDWSLTRRLMLMLKEGVAKHVTIFVTSTPMDIKRYTPHYIKPFYVAQYRELRDEYDAIKIVPAAWGIQKTKKFVKSYFKHDHSINVRDVSPKLVETVHSQCGGRPGYCKEFLDILYQLNDYNIKLKKPPILSFAEMRYRGEKKLSFSSEFEEYLSSRMQYSSIPIPPTVKAITTRHLDKLDPEAMLCLKTAASICISKGTRCLSFLKSSLKNCHPIKIFQEDSKINATLTKLVEMKFITPLPDHEDIAHSINIEDPSKSMLILQPQSNQQTLPCELYKMSSLMNNTQHGHLENKYHTNDLHHSQSARNGQLPPVAPVTKRKRQTDSLMDGSIKIKGRYGDASNNVVTRNRMHTSLSDASTYGLNHLRSLSSLSNSMHSSLQKGGTMHTNDDNADFDVEDEMKNAKVGDDENKFKYSDNMPATSTLVNKPLHKTPWKKGILIKKKDGMFHAGQERVFVFKGRTLYWFREQDTYPLGRIKFDESILRLKLDLKKFEITIKVSRKKYVLRSPNQDKTDIEEWHSYFQRAMNSDINTKEEPSSNHIQSSVIQSTEKSLINEDASVNFSEINNNNLRAKSVPNGVRTNGSNDYSNIPSTSRAISVGTQSVDQQNIMYQSLHGACYEFTHGFLRDCIYEQMLYVQRIKIHKRAQEYFRKVLAAISYLPEYPNKFTDTKDYSLLLQRHQAIESYYLYLQDHVGEMSADDYKKKKTKSKGKKKGEHEKYNFNFNFNV